MKDEVSPQGPGKEVLPVGEHRASHEDRDRVVEVLRVAAGDGRLTAEELDQRLEAALTARTYGELAVLTSDLPAVALPAMNLLPAPAAPVPQPKDVVRIDCHSGNAKRDGRWVVPRRIEVKVTSGSVHLDFTEAVVVHQSVEIDADVRSGILVIVTKPGIVVDAGDVTVRSGNVRVREPWGTDIPVSLRIALSGKLGSGGIVARPPRRTFWQWLLRRPRPYAITA